MTSKKSSRQSLLNLFSPPSDHLKGVFGLVCGLSAERVFMETMLEQFTGFSKRVRLQTGKKSLVLFQDKHNPPLQALSGLDNPWPEEEKWEKTKLMHAKVVLLGFGESATGDPAYYRLIVSTGNWTKEAVNNSINLVWYCDYDTTAEENQKQSGKDLAEAVFFFEKLTGYYQISDPVKKEIQRFLNINKTRTTVLKNIKPPQRGYQPHFFSNLPESKASKVSIFSGNSMGAKVLSKFAKSEIRRNFIICGSGFFEGADTQKQDNPSEPKVLVNVVQYLKQKQILTKKPDKWLVINPATSGAAGQWIKMYSDAQEWIPYCPKHPDDDKSPYPFHAKFIFIGNYNSTNSITSGLLYLGSGNLSQQGFAFGPGSNGNIEAGVVFEIQTTEDDMLCEQLGIDPEKVLGIDEILDDAESEEDEQPDSEIQLPPPIASCCWLKKENKLTWEWLTDSWNNVQLRGYAIEPDDQRQKCNEENNDFSNGVKLTAKKDEKCLGWTIPVFTEEGNFYTPPMKPKPVQELINDLLCFPATAYEADEENEDDNVPEEKESRINGGLPGEQDDFSDLRAELERFPLHLATTLVEAIASRNQTITKGQLSDWIVHLRRTLIDGMASEKKSALKALEINFLEPLIQADGFAPNFECPEYKKTIQEIANNWGFSTSKDC